MPEIAPRQFQPHPGRDPEGCSEALMHGFPAALLVEMVRDGLAPATPERMMAGNRAVEVTRVQITDAGRKALGR
jgi:hypothetical protein